MLLASPEHKVAVRELDGQIVDFVARSKLNLFASNAAGFCIKELAIAT